MGAKIARIVSIIFLILEIASFGFKQVETAIVCFIAYLHFSNMSEIEKIQEKVRRIERG